MCFLFVQWEHCLSVRFDQTFPRCAFLTSARRGDVPSVAVLPFSCLGSGLYSREKVLGRFQRFSTHYKSTFWTARTVCSWITIMPRRTNPCPSIGQIQVVWLDILSGIRIFFLLASCILPMAGQKSQFRCHQKTTSQVYFCVPDAEPLAEFPLLTCISNTAYSVWSLASLSLSLWRSKTVFMWHSAGGFSRIPLPCMYMSPQQINGVMLSWEDDRMFYTGA